MCIFGAHQGLIPDNRHYHEYLGSSFMEDTLVVIFIIISLALFVLVIAGGWKVFEKAGKPGWAFIVPIYNLVVLLEIVDKPIWWIILFIIPLVGTIFSIIVSIELADRFGKSPVFGIGLAFIPVIFYPILGFGSAEYMDFSDSSIELRD